MVCFILIPCSCLHSLSSLIPITPPSLSFSAHVPPSPLPLSSPFLSLHLTSLASSCHPRYPLMLSSVFPYSHPSSLICCLSLSCHAFIPPLLSFLSHLIPFSAHPFIHFPLFVSLVILLTACHWQFCLNSVWNVTFKNQQGTVSAVKLPWVSKLKGKVLSAAAV